MVRKNIPSGCPPTRGIIWGLDDIDGVLAAQVNDDRDDSKQYIELVKPHYGSAAEQAASEVISLTEIPAVLHTLRCEVSWDGKNGLWFNPTRRDNPDPAIYHLDGVTNYWMRSGPQIGSTDPLAEQSVDLYFDTRQCQAGQVYEGAIEITSNDPGDPVIRVPVTLRVTGAGPLQRMIEMQELPDWYWSIDPPASNEVIEGGFHRFKGLDEHQPHRLQLKPGGTG